MEKRGHIEIIINGSIGNIELKPDNYDIKEIISVLENVENLLFPSDKRDRPIISYKIEDGSVKHLLKTSIQFIIGFNAVIGQINELNNIDFLDSPTAKAIEQFQDNAKKKNYSFNLKTSIIKSNELVINKETNFYRSEAVWVDAELYFYGKLTNAGGKDKANIHILTNEFGTLIINTPISFLEKYNENLLCKTFGIRATGKQHSETCEPDKSMIKFIELIDYQPKYDEDYLNKLRVKAKKNWLSSVNPDYWLAEVRGGCK